MITPPLTILPVLNRTIDSDRSRSQYLQQASAIAKDLDPSSKFTLDAAKRIWTTYSRGEPIERSVETEITWNTNALDLELGVEEDTASSGMTLREPSVNGDGDVTRIAFAQHDSPISERNVDELLPTADDAMEIPPANIHPLTPNTNAIHHSDLHDDRSQTFVHVDTTQPHEPSPIDDSERSPRPDALMRGALMNSFQKAIHLRYPHLNLDFGKLRDNFARKLTDVEVQEFMRMGRGIVEDLKRSGKIEETKRKLAIQEQNDESGARRNRRRIDRSPSPVPADDLKSTDRVDISRHSDSFTLGGAPVASPIPTGQNEGFALSSTSTRSERPSTPIHSGIQKDTPRPSHLNEDVPVSMSPSLQLPPESPQSGHTSIPSNPDHQKDGSTSSHTNPESIRTADKQLHLHETADQVAMKPDDSLSDFGAPQILLAKVGQSIPDVSDVSFDIHERLFNAVQRWVQCWKEYDPSELHMRLYLTSIPTTVAEHVNRALPLNSSMSRRAESVANINVVWPPSGTFYVSLNEGRPEGMSWGARFFGPSSPPLDISSCVVSGKNTIRFIQLEDLSQQLFLILAMPPSEGEKQTRATWKKEWAQQIMSDTIKVQFKP